MKKEAILKMIDTFIRDLKEIRKDVEKFEVSEDAESYSQYTSDELAAFIAKTLEGRQNKLEILDKVADLSNTQRIERSAEKSDSITLDALVNIIESNGYEYCIRPANGDSRDKMIVFKDRYNNKEHVAFAFSSEEILSNIMFSKDLCIKNYS